MKKDNSIIWHDYEARDFIELISDDIPLAYGIASQKKKPTDGGKLCTELLDMINMGSDTAYVENNAVIFPDLYIPENFQRKITKEFGKYFLEDFLKGESLGFKHEVVLNGTLKNFVDFMLA